ncbi:RNA polymerase factor sigma-54 [Desmospora activa]|uniref:RNA polymerase RpoN-/SigL-like sigma 54 subunit n=1 Tax=Desmospora activa DSM 45169 TaxID=1121389 RepID=A0A2T4Z403_9BACL|nr:RNA polymerase factor sigma-54 [Desmospora activa]PTM56619.1 RNA polymerase RpoN-/SigL-like sigma 54 subunit [Desmospora activa DSM 45169]
MALSMGFGLIQDQRMKLAMTPELRQAIQVLQYSATELVQFLQEQALENPVLEVEGGGGEEILAWTDYWRSGTVSRAPIRRDDEDRQWEAPAREETLAEGLESQLRLMNVDQQTERIVSYLIGNLDEHGYLGLDAVQICKRFNVGIDQFQACLGVLQSMDPAGVGARSLSECLRLQLLRKPDPDPIALTITENHLQDIAAGRHRQVAKVIGCDLVSVQQAADCIKTLDPRPGLAFGGVDSHYIRPDVIVEAVNGSYRVTVNEGGMPRLGINTHYEHFLRRQDEEAQQALPYIKRQWQAALWLVKSVEQRRQTLRRVAQTIVDEQQEFFNHGISRLKPLTLRQIADFLGLHESTVSRATQQKYMQTPRGLLPFRYFFPSGVSTAQGTNVSAQSVKDNIARMIERERKIQPFSDQQIADVLQGEGVRISRRTVAKYREELGFPSSQVRRRYSD